MLNSVRPTQWIVVIVLLAMILPQSGYGETTAPELIVDAGEVTIHRSRDSVIVFVYVENVVEAIGGIDMWMSIDHDEVIRFMSDSVYRCTTVYYNCQDSSCSEWDGDSCIAYEYFNCDDSLECSWRQAGATRLEGTALENWEVVDAFVYGEQRMMVQLFGIANNGGGTPPIAPGQHLLVKLVAEISSDSGYIPDSLCTDSANYANFGVTVLKVDPRSIFSDATGTEFLGWGWKDVCRDSNCIEYLEDSCITWECIEWDSVYAPDTSKIYYYDGSVTLDCADCDWIVGDADASAYIDIDDVVYLINYIFGGGDPPIPVPDAGNPDCSIDVDIDDVVFLIAYIFQGGPPPLCDCWDLL